MEAPETRPFRVWLGFIAPIVAVLLLSLVPGPPQSVRLGEFQSRQLPDGSWGGWEAKPVEDVTKMHPMMPISAACLAAGWAWWFFWLYRRHQQLAQLTNSTYPVTRKQAVGLHFIPGYNLYWAFHWTRPFTQLCDLVESGLLKPTSTPDAQSTGRPPAFFAGNLSGVPGAVKPSWLLGAVLCLAMVVAHGALLPRNVLLRTFEVVPPLIFAYFFWSLIIALGVATVLDRRFVAAFAAATLSGPAPKPKATLGI